MKVARWLLRSKPLKIDPKRLNVRAEVLSEAKPRDAERSKDRMVEIQGVSKSFHKTASNSSTEIQALANVNLSIRENEFVSIIGPSGCGKTTLLKIIDGLLSHDGGEILIKGRKVTGPGPERAVVFQTSLCSPGVPCSPTSNSVWSCATFRKRSEPKPRANTSGGLASLNSRTIIRTNFPAACSSALGWRGRLPSIR